LRDPFESGAEAGAAGDAIIRAPMHGRVIALHVREGERVDKGQRLAIVEAMKMEHVLVAGVAGIVARVAVAAGAQVALGAPLITIHSGEEPHG
jgi:biotin carboxyl carrier protein